MKFIILILLFSLSNFLFSQRNTKPKLVVGIVVDQMCYDYLYRFQQHFSAGGFKKFLNQGLNCRNVVYNYVPTYTGPGHASIYTGTTPSNHGIVGNEWYNRTTNSTINCVSDENSSTIGSNSEEGNTSPVNLKTYTITDQLKLTYPTAKVVSISIKDRGAILPGGHLSDGTYWFDYSTGTFITSSFFKKELPKWVTNFNSKKNAQSYAKTWDLLLPKEKYQSVDDSPYEILVVGKTTPTFPYDLLKMSGGKINTQFFTASPFANTLLTDFALESISNENLGLDNQTDMLCISYSSTDIAGHTFGPYSLEIEDMYVRLDRELERLLTNLETKFGKDGFVVFLTADHAVVPVPQMLIDKKLPGGYLFLDEYMKELKSISLSKFEADLIEHKTNQNIYLNLKKIDSLKLNKNDIAIFFAEKIKLWPNVKAVFTSQELSNPANDNEWKDIIRLGYESKRSGEIIFIMEPGFLVKEIDSENAHRGTSHGSSFNYDTHVPLIWYGAQIPSKDVYETYEITDIAPTLTHILNLQRSGAMTGKPILEVLKK
ncbi:MAG: alkaline phosphatase family protein [Bacteroidetes bacterium]|nr:alkaline phosphatase family protein [Bacteroidota bacterium]